MEKEKELLRPDPKVATGEKSLDELAEELGVNKPPKVQKLDPERSIPVLHPPRPGDPEKAIQELEEIAKHRPEHKESEDHVREIPEEHQIPLEEASEQFRKTEK